MKFEQQINSFEEVRGLWQDEELNQLNDELNNVTLNCERIIENENTNDVNSIETINDEKEWEIKQLKMELRETLTQLNRLKDEDGIKCDIYYI